MPMTNALKRIAFIGLFLALIATPCLAQDTPPPDPDFNTKKAIAEKYEGLVQSGEMTVEQAMQGALAEAAEKNIGGADFAAMLGESLFKGATGSGMSPEAAAVALCEALYNAAANASGGAAEQAAIISEGIAGMRSAAKQSGLTEEQLQALNETITKTISTKHQTASGDPNQPSLELTEIAMDNVLNTAINEAIALTYTLPPGQGGTPPGQQGPPGRLGPRGPRGPGDPPPGPRAGTPAPDFERPASPAGV